MIYFDHHYTSNSELKEITDIDDGREKPQNIQEIFDLGTYYHQVLLEPHKADRANENYELARTMADTVLRDGLCQQVIMASDFRREHEFYRIRNPWGLQGVRCKCDGVSKSYSTILEYKGLNITTESAFYSCIERFGYDQSSCFYLDTAMADWYLLVGVSKKNPKKMFRCLIDRKHKYYFSGMQKIQKAIKLWKSYGLQ